uniref:MIP-T3 domain-containing protein n=1 Tax=Schistocephalus solidus TaxID=70667 RepID=A0A183TGP5_SCHSO
LMSVFEVRSCLAKAVMLLDLEATTLESISGEVGFAAESEQLDEMRTLRLIAYFVITVLKQVDGKYLPFVCLQRTHKLNSSTDALQAAAERLVI